MSWRATDFDIFNEDKIGILQIENNLIELGYLGSLLLASLEGCPVLWPLRPLEP